MSEIQLVEQDCTSAASIARWRDPQGWGEVCAKLPSMALIESGGVLLACNRLLCWRIGRLVTIGDLVESLLPGFVRLREGSQGEDFAAVLLRADGELAPVRAASGLIRGEHGETASLVLLMKVDSHPVPYQEGTGLHRNLLDAAPDAMAVTRDGRLVHFNEEFKRMFGFREEECAGQVLDDLVIPDGLRHESEILLHTARANGRASIETVRRTRQGEYVEVCVIVTLAKEAYGANELYVVYRDIRRQKETEARWEHRALHDGLTGLANRHLFLDRVRQTMARLKRRPDRNFAVLFLDLDRFKQVNDTLGHAAGDKLLLEATARLRSCLRPQDTIARMGGDEFALLLNEVESPADAARVAERIQHAMQREIGLGVQSAFVSASIGIALGSNAYERPEEIVRDADQAMYLAKQRGKARHEFFERGPESHS